MNRMTDNACKDCAYFHRDNYDTGECRRCPPVVVPGRLLQAGERNDDRGVWPEVPEDAWCGEFATATDMGAGS